AAILLTIVGAAFLWISRAGRLRFRSCRIAGGPMRALRRNCLCAARYIALASTVGLSAGVLRADTRIYYQQNANGQPYFYDFGNGHTVSGVFPNNNNWGQVQVISTDPFGDMYVSAPSNWSTPYYPGSPGDPNAATENVFLGAHTVTQDVNASSGTLNISSGGALNMLAGKSLSLAGDLADDGTITINSNGSGSPTVLSFGGGTMSGAGTVILSSVSTNSQLNGTLTQAAGHTIRGAGQINAAFTNNGTVNANLTAGPMT